ncbi:MAG: anti-sigma factor, partial [Candidatus Peribacteraceae bacterium]|nr:anti-sigma factor [Candidatus Peribacteraceae bacterium]
SRNEELDIEEIQYAIPQGGEVFFEGHGLETWFAYGAMNGVDGAAANGVTQSQLFEDGYFLHTANVNIAPAEDGYFYEGWIIKGSDVVSTGHLSNYFGDSRHSVRFESDVDYTGYLNVVITLEPDDGDPSPAGHMVEGKLKITER